MERNPAVGVTIGSKRHVAGKAPALRFGLELGQLNVAEDVRLGIYEGLCEAMTNTTDHAYQPEIREHLQPPFLINRWWITGSVTADGLKMDAVFIDQGISIPAHLPRTRGEKWNLLGGDAMMIKAVVETGRSAADTMNRGRGLAQIRDLADRAGTGRLRILSRRGEYIL